MTEQSLHEALATRLEAVDAMLGRVDLAKAEAWKEEDRRRIFDIVDKAEGGFGRVNEVVFSGLRRGAGQGAGGGSEHVGVLGIGRCPLETGAPYPRGLHHRRRTNQ